MGFPDNAVALGHVGNGSPQGQDALFQPRVKTGRNGLDRGHLRQMPRYTDQREERQSDRTSEKNGCAQHSLMSHQFMKRNPIIHIGTAEVSQAVE